MVSPIRELGRFVNYLALSTQSLASCLLLETPALADDVPRALHVKCIHMVLQWPCQTICIDVSH